MKKLLFTFALLISLIGKAQTVTIPDTAFVNWIQQRYPSCISGNQLDTACIDGLNINSLGLYNTNISNLFGLKYFVDLQNLNILNNTNLSIIPTFPGSLKKLNIHYNLILASLAALPNQLIELICIGNNLSNLPTLPNSLKRLDVREENFNSLPAMPNSLIDLSCADNPFLISLPTLPNSLVVLYCHNNSSLTSLPLLPNSLLDFRFGNSSITSLPALPSSLDILICYNTNLSSLPTLPNTLKTLNCHSCSLTSLPTLPNSLQNLFCNNNNLTSLPILPSSLNNLSCNNNNLSSLPTLPSSLSNLSCDNNNLTSLPALPVYFGTLSCKNNNLANLTNLPIAMIGLYCDSNNLTSLPVSMISLFSLSCSNNNLTSIPYLSNPICNYLNCSNNNISYIPNLPDSLYSLFLNNNSSLTCLPKIPVDLYNLDITNTSITCLPNTFYGNNLNIPICQFNSPNNPNNCPAMNVSGTVYLDQNNDCLYNWEPTMPNIPIMITNNSTMTSQQSNTNYIGHFEFIDIPLGTHTIKPDSIPIFLHSCIPNHTITLNTANPDTSGLDFGLKCKPNTFDLGTKSVLPVGPVFPGQQHTLKVSAGDLSQFFNFNCTASQNISATVTVNVSGPVKYVAPANGALIPTSLVGNILTYSIPNISFTNLFSSFNSLFVTDTTAQANDSVCVTVTITTPQSGDLDPLNNTYKYCYQVVNSYDPNIKVVNKEIVSPNFNDWLTYTIYFQNTGNAPAYNIKLIDTLDNALDLNTFEVIGYSHQNSFNLNSSSKRLVVNYPNILLPDSFSNPLGSIGYIQYRIKPKFPMALNSQINNSVGIYFDFNAPIITNTVTTTATNSLGLSNTKNKVGDIELQPNPASQSLTVSIGKEKMDYITISELSGKVLIKKNVNLGDNKVCFDLSQIENGLYLVNAHSGGKIVKGKKLVVNK